MILYPRLFHCSHILSSQRQICVRESNFKTPVISSSLIGINESSTCANLTFTIVDWLLTLLAMHPLRSTRSLQRHKSTMRFVCAESVRVWCDACIVCMCVVHSTSSSNSPFYSVLTFAINEILKTSCDVVRFADVVSSGREKRFRASTRTHHS